MKRIILLVLLVIAFYTLAYCSGVSEVGAQAAPTITPRPTTQVNVWYIFDVTILYRGLNPNDTVKVLNIRDVPSIYGNVIGVLYPNTVWWCDEAIPEGQNIWCKLSAQKAYIPLKYNWYYYTDWRE